MLIYIYIYRSRGPRAQSFLPTPWAHKSPGAPPGASIAWVGHPVRGARARPAHGLGFRVQGLGSREGRVGVRATGLSPGEAGRKRVLGPCWPLEYLASQSDSVL